MGYIDDNPEQEIVTEEQAVNWIKDQLSSVKKDALNCNAIIPNDKEGTTKLRNSSYRRFLTKHGGVLGMLAVLYRCKRLRGPAYDRLKVEAMSLLGPSLVIGRYDWFSNLGREDLTCDQARNWVLAQLDAIVPVRLDCNVSFPGNHGRTVEYQQSAERRFLVKLGGVLGMIAALHLCKLLSDVANNDLIKDAMKTMAPTIVGEHHIRL